MENKTKKQKITTKPMRIRIWQKYYRNYIIEIIEKTITEIFLKIGELKKEIISYKSISREIKKKNRLKIISIKEKNYCVISLIVLKN